MKRRDFNRMMFSVPGVFALAGVARAVTESQPSANLLAIVDTHAHVFRRDLKFAAVRRYVPDYDATPSDYLRQLDAHGIARGVLVQPSFLGTDNSYLVAALREHPQRLRGIAVVDPAISSADLRSLVDAGVVGVRLNLVGQALPQLDSEPWPAFLRHLRELDLLVEVQREAADLPRIVGPLLSASLKVVVDHFGRPDPTLGVDDPGFRYLLKAADSGRLWMKLSGAYRNGAEGVGERIAQAAVPLARAAFGAHRLLWGSDWPHTQFERVANYGAVRAQLDQWITNPAERTTILEAGPAELFRFPRTPTPRP